MSQAAPGRWAGQSAGFLSSARRLRLPPGPRVAAGGYHLDLRAKSDPAGAVRPDELPAGSGHVTVAQSGLGHYERFAAGEGERHLACALVLGRHLRGALRRERDTRFGGLEHRFRHRHGATLEPGWLSAMAQGEAASLFVRLFAATGDDGFAEAAVEALAPLRVPVEDGGVLGVLDGRPFPEEYPTAPQSHVLNGAVFAIWGVHDVAEALELGDLRALAAELVETLAGAISAWDIGYWSRYDLYPYDLYPYGRLVNVSSSFYQQLHVDQLTALAALTGDARLDAAAGRFARQSRSRLARSRAFAWKALFRLAVPR
jgi:hypothetical protein